MDAVKPSRQMDFRITLQNYRCFGEEPVSLDFASGLTAIIGINNSGKSSLLRFFYEFRDCFKLLAGVDTFHELLQGGVQLTGFTGGTPLCEVAHNRNSSPIRVRFDFPVGPPRDNQVSVTGVSLTIARDTCLLRATLHAADQPKDFTGEQIHPNQPPPLLRLKDGRIADVRELQSLMSLLANSFYIGPSRLAHDATFAQSYYDITNGSQFISHWSKAKTGADAAQAEKAYQLCEDMKRIFGFQNLSIDAAEDKRSLRVFINGKILPLTQLGSGLSHFLTVLGNVIFHTPSLILIDEPEGGLHPTLQVDFLTALASYAAGGTIYSTHSYGLARQTANAIYLVHQRSDNTSEVRRHDSTPPLAQLLGELNFGGYESVGCDTVVLVEDVCDATTLHHFLRLFGKHRKVLPLPVGGADVLNKLHPRELMQLRRPCSRIAAIIGSRRSEDSYSVQPDRLEFQDHCRRVDINCHILERRGLENYFTEQAVRRHTNRCGALTHFEIHDNRKHWNQRDNWRIARTMAKEELADTDLGQFLDAL